MTEATAEAGIDIESVARRVIAEPRRARVSVIEQLALANWALCTLRICGGVATLLAAQAACENVNDLAAFDARDAALDALKIAFEEEFSDADH